MKTSSQKYKRRHWYKFTDWQTVMWIALGNNSTGCCFGYAILEMEDEKPAGIEMN